MALVIAGILWIGFSYWSWWFLISPTTYEFSSVSLWVLRLALILTLAGLVELHMRHATSYGRLGLAAVLVTSLGIILTFVYGFLGSASIPLLLAMLLPLDLGLVLYGVAISRAGVLPRQLGWLLAGSGVIGAVSHSIRPFTRGASATDTSVKILVVSDVIFLILAGLCWVLLGYALWRQRIAIHGDNNKN
jgi:hypothetical protein